MRNFYRNLTYNKNYDENSFIARLIDYLEWSDKEYWKLEKDLINILKKYNKNNLPLEIMQGIIWILNRNLYNSIGICNTDKNSLSFRKKDDYIVLINEPSIEDRFRRLKKLLLCIAYDDKSFFNIDFVYKKPK